MHDFKPGGRVRYTGTFTEEWIGLEGTVNAELSGYSLTEGNVPVYFETGLEGNVSPVNLTKVETIVQTTIMPPDQIALILSESPGLVQGSGQTMPDNPKKLYGDKKPPLMQLPLVAQVAASLAHYDGDLKYGFRNWRTQPVEVMTYVNAAARHLRLYEEGEEFARDTGVPNLGAVIACCAILLDAQINEALIDNRSKSPAACDYLHEAEKLIETLKKAARERDANKV